MHILATVTFVVVVKIIDSLERAERAAKDIRDSLNEPHDHGDDWAIIEAEGRLSRRSKEAE